MTCYPVKGTHSIYLVSNDNPLGAGTNGQVFLAKKEEEISKLFAYKVVPWSEDSLQTYRDREPAILQRLDHPNIIKFEDQFPLHKINPQSLEIEHVETALITECAPGVELLELIEKQSVLEPLFAIKILKQIALTLKYCHDQNIAHRDIKPENILVDTSDPENPTIKLIDFGCACEIPQNGRVQTKIGTYHYMPPEMIAGLPYDPKRGDVWSLGVIFYLMLSGTLPYYHENDSELLRKIQFINYVIPSTIRENAPQCISLIRSMMQRSSSLRVSIDDLLVKIAEFIR